MAYVAAEVKNPNRNIVRALVLGTTAVTALYLMVNGAFLYTLGFAGTAVAATGRLSSKDPNLQNIPIRTEDGRSIRRAFRAADGCKLVSADYNQIELRVLADLSRDPTLMAAFEHGRDIHTATASEVFEVAEKDVTPEMRRTAKVINYGIIYGMGASRMARELDIARAKADDYIRAYAARYPGVQRFYAEMREMAGKYGYVETRAGRRRYLPDVHSTNEGPRQAAERVARWINSGGMGTMGVGLPYAMGVKLAFPDADVACVTGEASIQMCIQELSTCKQYRLPIKIVNLNNRYMGMVRQWQDFFHGNRYSESYMDALPDFVKLADGYGHVGMRIDRPADVEPALREAFKRKDDLVFMDFITDQTENVFPMVPGGKGLTEMILGEEL